MSSVSLRAKRFLLLSGAVLVSLALVESLLRLHERLGDPARASVDELLARSASSTPSAEIRSRSLRGLVRPSGDADLVYELKPGLEAVFKGRPLRINSQGLRGAEVEVAKPDGVLRILGLGDSVMFGWGVLEEEGYLSVLERCMNAATAAQRAPRVEVLNFAVPGYNTWMEVEAFSSRAVHFSPDLVILHMTDNDLELPGFMVQERAVRGLERLATVRYGRRALGRGPPPPPLLSPPEIRGLASAESGAVEERYAHMVGEGAVRRALERLARQAERLGKVPVIVLLLEEENRPGRVFAAEARRLGLRVVTLGEAFSRALQRAGEDATAEAWRRTFWLSAKDAHPNALGHAVIAQVLRSEIAALWGEERVCGSIPDRR